MHFVICYIFSCYCFIPGFLCNVLELHVYTCVRTGSRADVMVHSANGYCGPAGPGCWEQEARPHCYAPEGCLVLHVACSLKWRHWKYQVERPAPLKVKQVWPQPRIPFHISRCRQSFQEFLNACAFNSEHSRVGSKSWSWYQMDVQACCDKLDGSVAKNLSFLLKAEDNETKTKHIKKSF